LRAVDTGVDLVLISGGVPLFHLVPATEQQIRARQSTGKDDAPAAPQHRPTCPMTGWPARNDRPHAI
jgi:antitoxin (DNA-binding transcriptional repressor) of toxin-antitoxin stability system